MFGKEDLYEIACKTFQERYEKNGRSGMYNLGFTDGYNKAKEWHDLRKNPNDLPEDRRNVYVVYLNGENLYEKTIASYRYKYWCIDGHKTECEIAAWYELPTWGK